MKYIILSMLLISVSTYAEDVDSGCYFSEDPSACRAKVRGSLEDMKLQTKFYEALEKLDTAKNKNKEKSDGKKNITGNDSPNGFGSRGVRGRDVPKEETVSPVIFVDSVYGSRSLKAVVNLLGENITVSKGSSLFGGAWTVTKVNKDSSIVLSNGSKIVKISSAPLNITSILKQ
jgi:hypothetical protein